MQHLFHISFLLGLALLPAAALIAAPASSSATHTLFANQPATNWSQECYPIGNGRLGAMSFGGVIKEAVQFNEQSLWSGDNNWNGDFQTGDHGFGNYRNFGDFTIEWRQPDGVEAAANTPTDYRRELDLATGIHTTSFTRNGAKFTRESLASHPDQVLVFHYTADKPGSLSGRITLKSAQGAATSATTNSLRFAGVQPNTLRHAAELRLIPGGGKTRVEGDALVFEGCNELTLLLDARTNYKPDIRSGWRTGTAPAPQLEAAAKMDFATLRKAHLTDFTPFMTRAQINHGDTAAEVTALPTAERLKRYAANGADPDLEEMIFNHGRYLLVSCSRPGGLPANLQGLWCDSNDPPWASDYHSNINVEMNYWGAEAANLPECHEPLLDFFVSQAEACRIATRKEFGEKTRGWTARTSQSIFGGNGWNWNIPSSAWYATHVFDHWAFTRDRAFLTKTGYPMLKEICQLWEDRLKALPDGSLVVPQGWSPEHGPTEDGVMHDQQLIWELFEDYLIAARELGVDADYQKTIAGLQSRLSPNRIGKWGQLQEWQTDRDEPGDIHRHTSHLFAVYPGRQISVTKTPALAKAATISLLARSGIHDQSKDLAFTAATTTGDSRQSWAWPWRCGMWARLGDGGKAGVMVRGLLTYNTFPNLFTFACDRIYQIDGNLGITGVMAEMLLQSHADEISLLPAIPADWAKAGSFKGLRARGGYTVDCAWKDGRVTACRIVADKAPDKQRKVRVRVNGELREVTPELP
jgi:alpha-L-fucosidase 2